MKGPSAIDQSDDDQVRTLRYAWLALECLGMAQCLSDLELTNPPIDRWCSADILEHHLLYVEASPRR